MQRDIGIPFSTSGLEWRIGWRDLFFDLGEAVIQGALALPTGGATLPSAITSAMSALKSVSLDEPVETRAVGLFVLSLALAMDELVPRRGADISSAARAVAKKLKV